MSYSCLLVSKPPGETFTIFVPTIQAALIEGETTIHTTPKTTSTLHPISVQEVGFNHVLCWKSVNIRGILSKQEKFKLSSALLNIKYNYVVLFWNQLYWVLIHDSKYILS